MMKLSVPFHHIFYFFSSFYFSFFLSLDIENFISYKLTIKKSSHTKTVVLKLIKKKKNFIIFSQIYSSFFFFFFITVVNDVIFRHSTVSIYAHRGGENPFALFYFFFYLCGMCIQAHRP